MGLVKESRKFFVGFGIEILACQERLQARSQDSEGTLQLVRCVGRISCRSFQSLTRGKESVLSAFPLRSISFRIQRQLLDRFGKPQRYEMAGDETAQE